MVMESILMLMESKLMMGMVRPMESKLISMESKLMMGMVRPMESKLMMGMVRLMTTKLIPNNGDGRNGKANTRNQQ
ncbi:hypothetical protein BKH42_08935 [Helicobacter sp. 13S00482-2]|nr:hypothetical protein BKH42_08935 [Helicobacter sp. 13S00482-2]